MKLSISFSILFFAFLSCGGDSEEKKDLSYSNTNSEKLPVLNPDTIFIEGTDSINENIYSFDGKRDILTIELFGADSIIVRGELLTKAELKIKIHDFYKANLEKETDPEMPLYNDMSGALLASKISSLKPIAENAGEDSKLKVELKNLELKQKICSLSSTNSFREISFASMITIKPHDRATESFDEEISDLVHDVIQEIVSERSKEINWKSAKITDTEKKEMLKILIPERVVHYY